MINNEPLSLLTYEEALKAEYFVAEVRGRPYVSKNGRAHVLPGELHQFVHDPEVDTWFSPSLNNCNQPYFESLMEEDEYNKYIRCWNKFPSKEDCKNTEWLYEMDKE